MPTSHFFICDPMAIIARPGLDLSIEADTDRANALRIGHNMMAASTVGTINRLHQRELRICGRMHLDG